VTYPRLAPAAVHRLLGANNINNNEVDGEGQQFRHSSANPLPYDAGEGGVGCSTL
jgi:hypothetical protein